MARTITATTPYGTFARTTPIDYRFVALVEAKDAPERGIRVYGSRKGDPELATVREYAYRVSPSDPDSEVRTGRSRTYRERYHAVWSKTGAGALKNAEGYAPGTGRVLGVWPVAEAPRTCGCGAVATVLLGVSGDWCDGCDTANRTPLG